MPARIPKSWEGAHVVHGLYPGGYGDLCRRAGIGRAYKDDPAGYLRGLSRRRWLVPNWVMKLDDLFDYHGRQLTVHDLLRYKRDPALLELAVIEHSLLAAAHEDAVGNRFARRPWRA